MKELTWDRTLSIEVEEIDDDHRRLVGLFNLLNRAVADGEPADYLAALLEELISCTEWHFRHEERLMLRYGYPGLPGHAAEHRELIANARELQRACTGAGGVPARAELEYLEHWLTEHILVADMPLGAYLVGVM